MRQPFALLFNHADAWGVTLMISIVALIVHQAGSPHAFILVITLTFCYWLGFAVNDYFDAPLDAQDARKAGRNFFVINPQLGGHSALAPLFIGLLIAPFAVFASFGLRGVLIFCLAVFILWGYSAPPLRFKRRPGLDLVVHALFVQTFPYVVTLTLLDLPLIRLDGALIACFLLSSLGAQLEQQGRDYALDSRTEANFTARFGLLFARRMLQATTALLMLTALMSAVATLIPARLIPFGVIVAPILLHRFTRRADQPRSERLIRWALVAALGYAAVLIVMP